MTAACRVLADDLTGALDCAAAFAQAAEVPVALGDPQGLPSCSLVTVCATASRGVAPGEMSRRLAGCVDWLSRAELSFKKVDSLLRGNTFAELAWLAGSGRFRGIVFAPAFPALQRRVIDGQLVLARDGAASSAGVGLRQGLARFGMTAQPGGLGRIGRTDIAIPDAREDADLDAIVARFSGEDGVLWCGSAGLALALARARGEAVPGQPLDALPAGEVLVATASRHPVLRSQLARMRAMPSAPLRLEDFSSAVELSPPEAEAALAEGAARVVARSPVPGLLVAIGGDSLLALCEAAKVRALLAGPPPRPGWGSARLAGGRWDGVRCLSRSGAFGDPDDLNSLLASIGATAPGRRSPESASTT